MPIEIRNDIESLKEDEYVNINFYLSLPFLFKNTIIRKLYKMKYEAEEDAKLLYNENYNPKIKIKEDENYETVICLKEFPGAVAKNILHFLDKL